MWQRAAVGFKEAPNQVPPVREGFLKEVVCCNGRRSRSQLGEGGLEREHLVRQDF